MRLKQCQTSLLALGMMFWSVHSSRCLSAEPAVGVHGMVLFDDQAQLASHLPLYHSPHNYQAVLALEWDEALAQELAGWRQHGELITLVPQAFDMARLPPHHPQPLRELQVDIYRGHFERGGERQRQDVLVRITQVLYFSPIDQAQVTAADGTHCFHPLSWQGKHYLLEQIRTRPAQDMLVRLDRPLARAWTEPVCAPAGEPIIQGKHFSMTWAGPEGDADATLTGLRTLQGTLLYRETEDLQ